MADDFIPCSIDGCKRNAHKSKWGARGMCGAHYYRWKAHGNPLAGRVENGEPHRFFDEVVLNHRADECLAWPFNKNSAGYGMLKHNGKYQLVSRLVCEAENGPPPTPEHQAAHSCGNGHKACAARRHLVWKTALGNSQDVLTHGRRARGELQGSSRLKENQVREIRALRGIEPRQKTAMDFGITVGHVDQIQSRTRWSWLD